MFVFGKDVNMKILLVHADQDLLELLSFVVRRAGFRALLATDRATALQLLAAEHPDLLLLDATLPDPALPDAGGLALLECIRRANDLPVIVLAERFCEPQAVRAFDLGADDYVTQPIAFRALIARMRGLVRRRTSAAPDLPHDTWLRVGSLALNPRQHKATLDGLPLALTVTEFRLLQFLMDNVGCAVPHRVLLKQVWGYEDASASDVIRAAVSRLRRKLKDAADNPPLLRTLPGVGVMLTPGHAPEPDEPRMIDFDALSVSTAHARRLALAA